ncbi:MAG: hypothetical protein ACKO6N_06945 [Myxococcota bacterium]
MATDYGAAVLRHYEDASQLAGTQRFDNAAHLIGFAGECAIKHAWNAPTQPEPPMKHFPELRDAARKTLDWRRAGPMLAVLKELVVMDGWEVAQRYEPTGTITKQQ